ncbi:uncharacterized protein LOC106012964 [Aplysia californica]|uniref:Uncharacterized protein LOC106012964 n=1 Tax=Aplysia californica TaxID=6500 RepID=A0ABM1A8I5_APLCA|nr:uncharacterized protein LOC106012964 [Aplysia californica]
MDDDFEIRQRQKTISILSRSPMEQMEKLWRTHFPKVRMFIGPDFGSFPFECEAIVVMHRMPPHEQEAITREDVRLSKADRSFKTSRMRELFGYYALFQAARCVNPNVLRYILEQGVDPNGPLGAETNGLLLYAAAMNSACAVRLIIAGGFRFEDYSEYW